MDKCLCDPSLPPSPPLCCVAYLVQLSLPQENVIIPRPSIRWLSFKTCMRKALLHNRSVGACLLAYTMDKSKKQELKVEFRCVSMCVKPFITSTTMNLMLIRMVVKCCISLLFAVQTFILKKAEVYSVVLCRSFWFFLPAARLK